MQGGSNYRKHSSLTCRVDSFKVSKTDSAPKATFKRPFPPKKEETEDKKPVKKPRAKEGSFAAHEADPEAMETEDPQTEDPSSQESAEKVQSDEEVFAEIQQAKEVLASLQKKQKQRGNR